jgi:putative AlgH/UPF0301 family transcriptional regulator
LRAASASEGNGNWRSFRANLVSNEQQHQQHQQRQQQTNTSSIHTTAQFIMDDYESVVERNESWFYDSGNVLEIGTILLNHPSPRSKGDSTRYHYGLRKQWLHQSVLLILEDDISDPDVRTTGIILNRQTDLILKERSDENGNGNKDVEQGWNIWFGGDEFGIHTLNPKFFCLHSLKMTESQSESSQIIPGLYFCSLQEARQMVTDGAAQRDDFWVFSGFQTWDRRELEQEIKEGAWYSISTDANVVNKSHRILKDGSKDGYSSGHRIWRILMRLIGQRQRQHQHASKASTFCDRMLQEWSKKNLEFDGPPRFAQEKEKEDHGDVSAFLQSDLIKAGSMIQATPMCSRSSTLMSDQQFHQSTILILQDDAKMTVGVMLNMPSSIGIELWMKNEEGSLFENDLVTIPLRFGGSLGGAPFRVESTSYCEEKDPLFSLHMSPHLRKAKIGEPVGDNVNGVWKCSFAELSDAIEEGVGFVEDFSIIDGICVWNKDEDENGNMIGGIISEINDGKFCIVSSSHVEQVWKSLSSMEVLTACNVDKIIKLGENAWELGQQEEQVHSSNVDQNKSLHDEALKHWMGVYLNGEMGNDPT